MKNKQKEYRVHIHMSNQRTISVTNDMEDVRQQIYDQSRMDGDGFITVSTKQSLYDLNIAHIVNINYNEITQTRLGDGH